MGLFDDDKSEGEKEYSRGKRDSIEDGGLFQDIASVAATGINPSYEEGWRAGIDERYRRRWAERSPGRSPESDSQTSAGAEVGWSAYRAEGRIGAVISSVAAGTYCLAVLVVAGLLLWSMQHELTKDETIKLIFGPLWSPSADPDVNFLINTLVVIIGGIVFVSAWLLLMCLAILALVVLIALFIGWAIVKTLAWLVGAGGA